MELGIYSFAEAAPDPETGRTVSPRQRLADLLEEIELADRVGLDVFGVGEHHRPDYLASAPAVVLSAAAGRTSRIRLTSAVTVLGSDDPVRVFQQFSTLDLLSGGRAEIMAGRGFAELHRDAAARAGHPRPALGINSHGFIADSASAAADLAYPAFADTMNRIGRERGWPPTTRAQFDASLELRGANFVGGPREVINKILFQHEIFGHDRFLLQITVGTMPHDRVMRSIELFGTEVAPAVRADVARRKGGAE